MILDLMMKCLRQRKTPCQTLMEETLIINWQWLNMLSIYISSIAEQRYIRLISLLGAFKHNWILKFVAFLASACST
jgi:hypothetical protein